jgi:outer membrane protein TolC
VNELQQQQQQLQYDLLKTEIRRDLQVAYDEYKNALAVSDLEKEYVKLAKENNFISTERFRKLQSNSIELRQAQLSLIEAQDRYINAAYRAKVAAATLQLLAGEVIVQ